MNTDFMFLDCVSFKPNSTNILVQNLWCNGSHGISVGSLGQYKGEYDIVQNIYVYNISMHNASVSPLSHFSLPSQLTTPRTEHVLKSGPTPPPPSPATSKAAAAPAWSKT